MNCPYCNRNNFKSSRGLTHHQQNNRKCREAIRKKFGVIQGNELPHTFASLDNLPFAKSANAVGTYLEIPSQFAHEKSALSAKLCSLAQNREHLSKRQRTCNENEEVDSVEVSYYNDDGENHILSLDSDDSSAQPADDLSDSSQAGSFNVEILRNWRQYCEEAPRKFLHEFPNPVQVALNLLISLRKTKASLNTYELMMDWHFRANEELKSTQKLSDHIDFFSREKIFKSLRKRYNFTPEKSYSLEEITLPHSKARVQMVLNDPQWVIQSLLTDPRITDEDYIFGGKSPFKPPKSDSKYICDLNTGRAYITTYNTLITDPTRQILLPVIFYIDAANTGQFVDLPITAVKISLGIFTRKARDKPHLWGTLGCIPSYCKHVSRGRQIVLDSGHMSGMTYFPTAADEEEDEVEVEAVKAQDLHAMLDVILGKYVNLQETGFKWDLFYGGKCYEGVEFVLFTPFLKLDSDEAEKLCGKYTSRSGNVKCLCRYCECPTADTDKPYLRYSMKTTAKIMRMVEERDLDGLRNISQQDITNSTYKLRFGTHNNQGVHGACPMEMLHAMILGIFRYIRDCFFEQIGPESALADEINAYAREFGDMLGRQSQRDLPRTKFSNGIRKGKLNAKDFPGILLCMACVLRCSGSRRELSRHRGHFKEEGVLQDWLHVVETLLQWEMWLKSDRLRKKHVIFAQEKHRYVMYLIKKVGKRVKGMGLKITKFHSIMHMADDILNFGVPMEYDTGSNESGHKKEKIAAKLTQKNKALFDIQTCRRLEEVHLLDLAVADMQGIKLWNYYHKKPSLPENPQKQEPSVLGGQKIRIYRDVADDTFRAYIESDKKKADVKIERQLIKFFGQLQCKVCKYCKYLCIYSTYRRDEFIFRASTEFMSKAWRDWAIIDWGEEAVVLLIHIVHKKTIS